MVIRRPISRHINNHRLLHLPNYRQTGEAKTNEAWKIALHEPHIDFYEGHDRNTLIYKLDPRIKLTCAVAAILTVLFMAHWQTATLVFVSCLFLITYYKGPVKRFLKQLISPLYIIIMVAAIQPFTYGSTLAFQTPILALPIYIEGLWFALLIFTRCLAAVAILNLLVMTTPIMKVMEVLSWFRVPAVLLDVALLMFRYIFIISDEAERIHKAQKSRCGYSQSVGYFGKLRNYGTLFGMLLIRSYERAVRVGNAMIARGYKGETLFSFEEETIPVRHLICGIILLLIIVSLILADCLLL